MSQFSTHVRAPVKAEKQGAAARGRAMTKASGDATNPCKPANNRSKSKINKLPKNLRYDLETALVGLCDVWFEEIKPHLVQNNIKLHVNTKAAGSDHQMVESAAGCSHLDPGSTAGQCELCRLLLRAASNIETAMSQAAHAAAPAAVAAVAPTNGERQSCRRPAQ